MGQRVREGAAQPRRGPKARTRQAWRDGGHTSMVSYSAALAVLHCVRLVLRTLFFLHAARAVFALRAGCALAPCAARGVRCARGVCCARGVRCARGGVLRTPLRARSALRGRFACFARSAVVALRLAFVLRTALPWRAVVAAHAFEVREHLQVFVLPMKEGRLSKEQLRGRTVALRRRSVCKGTPLDPIIVESMSILTISMRRGCGDA